MLPLHLMFLQPPLLMLLMMEMHRLMVYLPPPLELLLIPIPLPPTPHLGLPKAAVVSQ
jgi:hypothetical protein